LRSIGDGVITTDAECNVEYINPVAEELTGWKVDDASGRPIDEIFRGFHEETCEPLENPLAVSIRRSRSIKSVRPARAMLPAVCWSSMTSANPAN
jgi:PAS domain S-box-containing protein